ncbi:MAG TPA: hypothetical protein ENN21_01010 [Spirochaetes bacterium]|nr:hypothetical protein [Spirochaetota bacterium]
MGKIIASVVLVLGVVNLLLVAFQLLSGLRLVKAPFSLHRKTGIALAVLAALHGALAVIINL